MTSPILQVHISGTATHLDEDMNYLRAMFRAVHNSKAIVAREWLDSVHSQYDKYQNNQLDWRTIYHQNIDALERSDLIIIDATRNHLYQGHQAFIASHRKKPTLIVTRTPIEGHFISGISDKYLTIKTYKTEEELEVLIAQFIKSNTIPANDLRFNLFLNRRIYKYLRDKSYESGKNKSTIVRELLEKRIERHDE